ncbi:MAG TPA: hypothetical protein VLW85_15115 [Myxococcales bacterium]|nr:hypothetical protein [Myxococcales bacterium]
METFQGNDIQFKFKGLDPAKTFYDDADLRGTSFQCYLKMADGMPYQSWESWDVVAGMHGHLWLEARVRLLSDCNECKTYVLTGEFHAECLPAEVSPGAPKNPASGVVYLDGVF